VYHLLEDRFQLYSGDKLRVSEIETVDGLHAPGLEQRFGYTDRQLLEEIELVRMAGDRFDLETYRAARLTPVFFGSAINNFGVRELLDGFVEWAPAPSARIADFKGVKYEIFPEHKRFTGFCFKIQANMDPRHRDRIAFLRVCSGKYQKGMQLYHVRLGKSVRVSDAVTFMAAERQQAEEAYPGDILGLHNHGTIALADSFTEGEALRFSGIPNFAPELFRRVVLKDPLKAKALNKGLDQLCEEGATQVFRPLSNNDIILGAVGTLQFDVVKERLETEYGVACVFDTSNIHNARWVYCEDPKTLKEFRDKNDGRLALDHSESLVYLASSRVNFEMAQERFPQVRFMEIREHHSQ
ncbi:MAG: EF-Tu/IF-2/RF-3 family GTPase, partial [Burkholderiales bacterium]